MQPSRGKILRLFIGNMSSGKTRHLLQEIDTLRRYGNKHILIFTPAIDTRSGSGQVKSRTGDVNEAVSLSVNNPVMALDEIGDLESSTGVAFDIIAFDEVQFFARDSGFFGLVQHLLTCGYDVLASGLALDFRGEPFGSTPDIALLAEENTVWMTSYCTRCGEKAPYPQKFINGKPAPYNSEQICVGGEEMYEPRCDRHFVLPGRH